MNRRDRFLTMAMIGMSAAAWGCGGQGRQAGSGAGGGSGAGPGAALGDLELRVQALEDSLKLEKERLRKYFGKAGTYDKIAWVYWQDLAKAICQIERHMSSPTFPPVQDRVCPKTSGPPDKLTPPAYPPQ
jgi:hypothetical protein